MPNSTLYYVAPGQHTLYVSARDSKLSTNISEASNFTVTSCPLCYTCPVGNVHPVFGQCCQNGNCDSSAYTNFGPPFYTNPKCQQATFPGSTTYLPASTVPGKER